ncbi:Translin [Xylariomycetidae sp. FL0641]|nr:Translin [Xylariomycetidae sp. FL0641]
MSEVVIPQKRRESSMAGVKRDHQGKEKPDWKATKEAPRNAYTPMFEFFRSELDEHHDRRNKIGKVSRDVTALSKKIIFSLQRVRKLGQPIPPHIAQEISARKAEIAELLATIEEDVQGMNRHRYGLICLEEYVEAVSFAHYLETQTLMTPAQAQAALQPVGIPLTAPDYVFGIFDLTGEMMRFATAVTALSGRMPSSSSVSSGGAKGDQEENNDNNRTILTDMQDIASTLQICPPVGGRGYGKKLDVMAEQTRKVERLGYGVRVRGSERPKGWMPDLSEAAGGGGEDVVMG